MGAKNTIIKIAKRDGWACRYCGTTTKLYARTDYMGSNLNPDEATIDHIIPTINGGTNDTANKVIACRRCNSRKGKKSRVEFALKCHSFRLLESTIERISQ